MLIWQSQSLFWHPKELLIRLMQLCCDQFISLKSLKSELRGHVVAEMRDIDNTSLVELVGGESVETIVSHDIVGRLMIQVARSKGLAEVYAELLGFEGDEIYIKRWPEFIGKTFDEVLLSFDTAVPIGIATSTLPAPMGHP